MQFAMEHFQTKKPRDKARREFRRWRMSPAGHSRVRAIREVSGKSKRVCSFHFQQKKMPYGVGLWNSRRGHASSTRWTPAFRKSHLAPILPKSRQNSPEGLVYGNSNATTAFANSRLVVPALWVLAAKLTHWTLLAIFASYTITEDREQGFD